MASQLQLLQEAARRGLPIPPAKKALLDEAMKRGLLPDSKTSTAGDVGLSALSSVPKAIASIAGQATDLGDALYGGLAYGAGRLQGKTPEEASAYGARARTARQDMRQGLGETGFNTVAGFPGSSGEIRQGLENKITGPLYEPQTRAGQVADTVGQFTTGALAFGSGGLLPRLVQGAVPGLISEGAGQLPGIEGTAAEPWARGGAALLSGVATHKLTSPQGADRIISDAMQGVTPQQMSDASRLVQASNQAGGVPLTWPEAIQHVTGGRTTLDDVSRYVEQSSRGGPIMRGFYADRPQQVIGAVNRQANSIDAMPRAPEAIAPQVQQGAQQHLDQVTGAINQQTRPLYNAAHPVQLSPAQMQAIRANPAFAGIVQQLRADRYAGPHFQGVADDSIEMLDAVQKVMRGDAEGLRQSTQGIDRYAASLASGQRGNVLQGAQAASPEYARALNEQANLRRTYLNPLEQGPTGKLAATDQLEQQLGAIFPANPLPGSEQGVAAAVRAVSRRDPALAGNLVGAHIDRTLAEAAQNLASGPNQAGGAKFAAVIAGNSQQARNLEAAIRALPSGDSKWRGFRNLLDNLEATGTRKAIGSPTAINETIKQNLKAGSLLGVGSSSALSPGRWTTAVSDLYQGWRVGRNTEVLARIFTDPTAEKLLARLALHKPGSREALDITARVLAITQGASNSINNPRGEYR